MSDHAAAWAALTARMTELDGIAGAAGLLEWDQQTNMPPGGAGVRGQQMAVLSSIYHERFTASAVGDLLDALADDPDPTHRAAVRNIRRKYDRATLVPARLVEAAARASSDGFAAWGKARADGSFAPMAPALQRHLDIARETIACYSPAAHPYDQLLEEYDPGSTTAALIPMFDRLGAELSAFVQSLDGRAGPAALQCTVSKDDLMRLNRRVITALGFRDEDGRIDVSAHPFTIGFHPHDVRITTRLHTSDLWATLYGTIHECGHAMYEQGLPAELAGTSLCAAAGTGLHESQSRFWENVIGRSRPFAGWLAGVLDDTVPGLGLGADALYAAANRVTRSLIRVSADEATYNLHIIVRFQLELALITGELSVADLPDAWDDAYSRVLGIRPSNPVEGVLQDIHWASGLFGYFPSYTIGNLYAASLAAAMEAELPEMWDGVKIGQFGPILEWLRARIHRRGHLEDAPVIFRDAVGDRDPVADLMAHLRGRLEPLYQG